MSGQITKVFEADTRRRWSEEEKRAIIEESRSAPVSRVAKKHGMATSLLFRWRKMDGVVRSRLPAQSPKEQQFVRLALPAAGASPARGAIEIVLGNGRRVIVGRDADMAALKRVIAALGAA